MPFRSFEEVRTLADPDLHRLLVDGDPPERVWAAWSLAYRLGGDAVTTLSRSAEPDPGVRAHLVVVLAGLQQYRAVLEMASSDSDPGVRAAACAYVIRTTAASRRAETLDFLVRRIQEEQRDEPIGRILQELPGDWVQLDDDVLARIFARGSAALSGQVLDYLLRTRSAETLPSALLSSVLHDSSDAALVERLGRLLGPAQHRDILNAAMRVSDSAASLLQVLVDGERQVSWTELCDLPAHDDPRIHLACLRLTADWYEPRAAMWLAALAMASDDRPAAGPVRRVTHGERDVSPYEVRAAARAQIAALIASTSSSLPVALAPALRHMIGETEGELAWMDAGGDEYLEDEGFDPDTERQRLGDRRALLTEALQRCR